MVLRQFCQEDIGHFLALAAAEQWVTGQYELDFLLTAFPDSCFCMQDETGAAVGFSTSLKHDRSGWIGNLIVRPDRRGTGIGAALFARTMTALHETGAETIWLTASEMGRPLYEKHGFKSIDRIIRWAGTAQGADASTEQRFTEPFDSSLDSLCWGDRRERLLAWTTGRGVIVADQRAWCIVQPIGGKTVQIGPCAALDQAAADGVISRALAMPATSAQVVCDAPFSNGASTELFRALGFIEQGNTHLMYSGTEPDYRSAYLYGLATLGSSG